jgi:hypothetical protein
MLKTSCWLEKQPLTQLRKREREREREREEGRREEKNPKNENKK